MPHRGINDPQAWLDPVRGALWTFSIEEREKIIVAVIRTYAAEVNRRAGNKMLMTGKTDGAHLAAMLEINAELSL
jgi:hypothetical protein